MSPTHLTQTIRQLLSMGFFLLDGNDERRGEAQRQANPTAPWRERMRLQSKRQ
jgi:hypothetical protein